MFAPPTVDELRVLGAAFGLHLSAEDAAIYRGYFENRFGEQAIFLYERDSGRGTLYLGDAGWEQPHAVHDGAVQGLVLSPLEQMWLQACWSAALGDTASEAEG